MVRLPDNRNATAGNGGESQNIKASDLLLSSLDAGTDFAPQARRRAQACVVVVRNGGRWTRAVYLSLHSANQAVDRARARGADPYLVLVELVPVGPVTR